jgi:hypothetical protein
MTYSWQNEEGEPIISGEAYRFEQQLDADYAAEYYGSPEYLDSLDDEPDEDDHECSSGDANQRPDGTWECCYCGEPVDTPEDAPLAPWEYEILYGE